MREVFILKEVPDEAVRNENIKKFYLGSEFKI